MIRVFVAFFAAVATVSTANAKICESTPERHAAPVLGRNINNELSRHAAPYVAGDRSFYQEIGKGWWFGLVKQPYGWSLQLKDGPDANSVDLSTITPPYRGPNPRQIYGWHFRNAANTGPNEGDVNAPQEDRLFFFSEGLSGTGGYKPPKEGAGFVPGPEDGLGWLKILDFGLADLAPGEKARMNYLEFEACITWPKTAEEKQREADAKSPVFLDEEREIFGSCGLDLAHTYDLDAAILPRALGGDIDGDGSIDEIAQIRRKSDGKRGLALCRAGTWMHVLGMDGEAVGEDLEPGYFDQMEVWNWRAKNQGPAGFVAEEHFSAADGDIVVLERIEKQVILLYWKDGALRSNQIHRFVEP